VAKVEAAIKNVHYGTVIRLPEPDGRVGYVGERKAFFRKHKVCIVHFPQEQESEIGPATTVDENTVVEVLMTPCVLASRHLERAYQ